MVAMLELGCLIGCHDTKHLFHVYIGVQAGYALRFINTLHVQRTRMINESCWITLIKFCYIALDLILSINM